MLVGHYVVSPHERFHMEWVPHVMVFLSEVYPRFPQAYPFEYPDVCTYG